MLAQNENVMDTYTYRICGTVYVNLTNRCTNDCVFCVRQKSNGVGGYDLRISREPDAEDVIADLTKEKPLDVVFCGYGEPTMNLEALKGAAKFVKGYGGRVRVNTNGHGSLVHGRDIVPELAGIVDEVSISLNEADRSSYAKITNCQYGPDGFDALLSFAEECVQAGIHVVLSVVDCISDEKIERCRQLASDAGCSFRVRSYVP